MSWIVHDGPRSSLELQKASVARFGNAGPLHAFTRRRIAKGISFIAKTHSFGHAFRRKETCDYE